MSDQTPSLSNLGSVDGSNLINVPSGGGGITLAGDPIVNIADQPLVQVQVFIDGIADVAFTFDVPVPNSSVVRFDLLTFLSGHKGIVSDPGAAAATDYLGADNTFRPIPSVPPPFASGVAGIVTDPGAAAATDYLGADNTFRPIPSPTPAPGEDHFLGSGLGLDVQAIATYPLYTVPGGVTGAIISKVFVRLASGDPSNTGDGLFNLDSTAETANKFAFSLSTSSLNPVSNSSCFRFDLTGASSPKPLYGPGDVFRLDSLGGTDPCTIDIYVYGFLIP